jgi:hypothetical protein
MKYFDYESVAQKAGIPSVRLAEWRELFEREYHAK